MEDQSFLEKLDVLVCEESRIVTFQQASDIFDISYEIAKKLLGEFYRGKEQQLSAVFAVSGLSLSGLYCVFLVSNADLAEKLAKLSKVISQTIYSVQKSQPKDMNLLSYRTPSSADRCLFSNHDQYYIQHKNSGNRVKGADSNIIIHNITNGNNVASRKGIQGGGNVKAENNVEKKEIKGKEHQKISMKREEMKDAKLPINNEEKKLIIKNEEKKKEENVGKNVERKEERKEEKKEAKREIKKEEKREGEKGVKKETAKAKKQSALGSYFPSKTTGKRGRDGEDEGGQKGDGANDEKTSQVAKPPLKKKKISVFVSDDEGGEDEGKEDEGGSGQSSSSPSIVESPVSVMSSPFDPMKKNAKEAQREKAIAKGYMVFGDDDEEDTKGKGNEPPKVQLKTPTKPAAAPPKSPSKPAPAKGRQSSISKFFK